MTPRRIPRTTKTAATAARMTASSPERMPKRRAFDVAAAAPASAASWRASIWEPTCSRVARETAAAFVHSVFASAA